MIPVGPTILSCDKKSFNCEVGDILPDVTSCEDSIKIRVNQN